MKSKILVIVIAFLFAISACACSKSETDEASETESIITQTINSATPTEKSTEVEKPLETPEMIQEHYDMDYVLGLLLEGEMVFMEDTEDMNANLGAMFGDVEKKQIGEGGFEFTFVPNINEHLPLLTNLDEFDGAVPKSGQAIFIRFKTTTAGIYFSFLGDNDFGIYFGNDGEPLVFTYTESNPFAFEGELKLETDKWYNMLMAMDSGGKFNCMIYADEEIDSAARAMVDLGATGSAQGYINQSWQFEIATHEEGAVTVEHYDIYTYTEFEED